MNKLDEALLDAETRYPDLCPSAVIRDAAKSYSALLKLAPDDAIDALNRLTKNNGAIYATQGFSFIKKDDIETVRFTLKAIHDNLKKWGE